MLQSKEVIKNLEKKRNIKDLKYLYKYHLGYTDSDYINNKPLSLLNYLKLNIAVLKLNRGANIFHIIGNTENHGNPFKVNKHTLIPRRETEDLIDKTIRLIKSKKIKPKHIIDLGTGSGVIAISLAKIFKNSRVTGIDISRKALKVARYNNGLNKTKVKFKKKKIEDQTLSNFDIIISNPPYLTKQDLIDQTVLKTEPHQALFAKKQGLIYYQEILKKAQDFKLIAFEIGKDHGPYLVKLAKQRYPHSEIILEQDFNNMDRYLFIINV